VRNPKTRYWIKFRIPGGAQRKEYVGTSIDEARDADSKRRVQKREKRIFDMLPEANMTFEELTTWYCDLDAVKELSSFARVKQALANFNAVFGSRIVGTIQPMDIEKYQAQREKQVRLYKDGTPRKAIALATIDMEISIAKTMINKAFDNDMVDGRTVKAFKVIKKKLKKAANARKQTLGVADFLKLRENAAKHLQPILTVAYNTGMRAGELRLLEWAHIDRKGAFIRLPADLTKEGKAKAIPMNHHVQRALQDVVPALHHGYVFTYKGEPIREKGGLKRSFKTACKNSEIICGRDTTGGLIFHDIRRSVKTNMLAAGVSKEYRDLILGHSLQGMDAHYISVSDDDLRAAMDTYTAWLDREMEAAKGGTTDGESVGTA
jgi:integrase